MSDPVKPAPPSRITLVSYPKIIFFYPTLLVSLLAGVILNFTSDAPDAPHLLNEVVTSAFLGVFAINLVVFAFDFPRGTSLALFFLLAAIVLGFFLLIQFEPNLIPFLQGLVKRLHPRANATFYHIFSIVVIVILIAVLISVRFDYWEVTPNELVHHHGILSDLERYASPNLRISKETTDIFEYLLLRSGRLILHPANEPRVIVLDNVLFIDRKEAQLVQMLGVLQVELRSSEPVV